MNAQHKINRLKNRLNRLRKKAQRKEGMTQPQSNRFNELIGQLNVK